MYAEVKQIATLSLTIPQQVRCEECGHEFFYEMKLATSGEASSAYGLRAEATRGKADEKARKQMDDLLKDPNLCHAIPCPECLHYQAYMRDVSALDEYARWDEAGIAMLSVGCLPLVIAGVAWFLDSPDNAMLWGSIGGVLFVLGITTLVLRSRLMSRHDPNAMSERKRRKTAEDALTFEELQHRQEISTEQHYRRFFDQDPEDEPFVIDLWLTSAMIAAGGRFELQVPKGKRLPFAYPAGVEDGTLRTLLSTSDEPYVNKHGYTFLVRLRTIRVHPLERAAG